MTRFHLAFPVTDLEETRSFYGELLGAGVGREDARWIDFDFFGHQLSAHLVDDRISEDPVNAVDGDSVPCRHFGVILDWEAWQELADRLRRANVQFAIEPHVRFSGKVGEQATMFFRDPSGNALEFKAFRDPDQVFAHG